MSDYPTWAQRKAWNNDGMDPDWRPEPDKFVAIEAIMRIYGVARSIANKFQKYSEEDFLKFKEQKMVLRVDLTIDECLDLRTALKEFKGEKNPHPTDDSKEGE